MVVESPRCTFTIPDRMGDMNGSAFAATIMNMPANAARELAIYQQFELGNVPDFLRRPRQLTLADDETTIQLDVLPDVLCVGTDDDFMRVPMTPHTAQRIADLFSASLITPQLSDQIWLQADVRLDPMELTMPPTVAMTSTKWFVDQNAKIEKARAGRQGLVAGHKKDIVIANELADFPDRVAIYGWHLTSGKPIQGLNPSFGVPFSHTQASTYVDYSHGVRLVAQDTLRDGVDYDFLELGQDPQAAALINGRSGVLKVMRYAAR